MPVVGAPIGNQNARHGKLFQSAIKRALARKSNESVDKGLEEVATKLVDAAYLGEPWAIKEIGDRLEGKPAQAIIGGSEDDPPIQAKVTVEYIGASPASEKA